IEKNLLSHVGKSPEVTMGARLAATLKKDSADNPLVRVKPGVFALREWDDKTIKAGLEPRKGGGKKGHAKDEAPEAHADGPGEEAEAAAPAAAEAADEDDEVLIGGEEPAEAAHVRAPTGASPSAPRAPVVAEDEDAEEIEVEAEDEVIL